MLSLKRHKSNDSRIIIPSLETLKPIMNMSEKRAFFLSSVTLKGSMALEGSMVLPIFLFFIMTILLSLETVRIQSNMLEALHQTGNEYAFMEHGAAGQEMRGANAAEQIAAYMGRQQFPYLCVAGGEDGIKVQDGSSAQRNGLIYLKASYRLKPFIRWIPIGDPVFEDEFYSHAWVGYCGNEEMGQQADEDVYVYITETGKKYHLSSECTYLRIPVKMIGSEELREIRNASGGKYYPCEKCRPTGSDMAFISEDGSRYHGHSDCPSLKRTVSMVPLSKAQGYTPCSKCGGQG